MVDRLPDTRLAPEWLTLPDDVNALDRSIWPDTIARDADGAMSIGGVSVRRLAQEYRTPLSIIDKSTAIASATAIRDGFREALAAIGTDVTVYYASKAFLSTEFVRWMLDLDLNIDVATGGELAFALAAGAPANRIGLHGNNKSDDEIDLAVQIGVAAIIIDSRDEIDRVAECAEAHGVVQKVRIRVNSGVHAHTHDFLATSREDQKFGIALTEVEDAVAAIRARPHLRLLGMHSHIGSQIFDAGGHIEAIRRLMDVQARLLKHGPVPELNIGGGFGIAYTPADRPTSIGSYASEIARALQSNCERLHIPIPHIAIEPGRAIVGRAGITVYSVGTIKPVTVHLSEDEADQGDEADQADQGDETDETDEADQADQADEADRQGHGTRPNTATAVRTYVSVDGGMSDNARPALYGADYSVALASRSSSAAPELVRVVGKHCESGDIVVDADFLPSDVHRGDILAVAVTGAYCASLSSNYNMMPRPAVVAVAEGAAHVLVRRETIGDLLARDAGVREES